MKVNFATQESTASEETEKKVYGVTDKILYPSNNKIITLAMLKWDFDIVPNDAKGVRNPNCDLMTTHNLPKAYDGRFKVKSNRPIVVYVAKDDVVKNGKAIVKKGQKAYYFTKDSYKQCDFTTAMEQWKEFDDTKGMYRRSGAELFALCYVFTIENVTTKEVQEVNDVCVVNFNMIDLLKDGQVGIGNAMFGLYDEDDEVNDLKNSRLIYLPKSLTTPKKKKELTQDELAIIEPLREKYDELMQEKANLLPLEYDVLIDAIKRGEYALELPYQSPTKETIDISQRGLADDEESIPF